MRPRSVKKRPATRGCAAGRTESANPSVHSNVLRTLSISVTEPCSSRKSCIISGEAGVTLTKSGSAA